MLTVICGGMFAEKSTELQRRGKRLRRAGKKVAYFKPDIDNRYSDNALVTHDGASVRAINIPSKEPHYLLLNNHNHYDVFLIDEIQFFHGDVIQVIEVLILAGKTVIVAGLDMDSDAKPFIVTATLMAVAEEVVKLRAVCAECGDDSWVSYNENKSQRIEIGSESYKPLCRKCFNKKQNGGN